MGGYFGAVSREDAISDVFFGTDYHSHLGTKRAGMAAYDYEIGLQREIHSIESSPFRTRFEHVYREMKGFAAIGCISDHDPQPLLIGSGLGTYAKYVTGIETDSHVATVAKWGYVVTANTTNLFGTSYATGGTVEASSTANSVAVSADSDKIVAPGTKGSMTISINGQAEVKSQIVITTNDPVNDPFEEIELLTTDGTTPANYKPVEWTLKVNSAKVGGVDDVLSTVSSTRNFQDIVDELAKLGNDPILAYTETLVNLELSWEWDFYTSELNDTYDTMLGDLVAGAAVLNQKYGANQPTGTTSFSWDLGIKIEQLA